MMCAHGSRIAVESWKISNRIILSILHYKSLHLQILLHGASVPIRVGRHSGSSTRQTNSATRAEHFELIRYWKCSYSMLVSWGFLNVVRSYWSTPRHSGRDVDLQMPRLLREKKKRNLWVELLFPYKLTCEAVCWLVCSTFFGNIESFQTFGGYFEPGEYGQCGGHLCPVQTGIRGWRSGGKVFLEKVFGGRT